LFGMTRLSLIQCGMSLNESRISNEE